VVDLAVFACQQRSAAKRRSPMHGPQVMPTGAIDAAFAVTVDDQRPLDAFWQNIRNIELLFAEVGRF